jgi:hypothetical protein
VPYSALPLTHVHEPHFLSFKLFEAQLQEYVCAISSYMHSSPVCAARDSDNIAHDAAATHNIRITFFFIHISLLLRMNQGHQKNWWLKIFVVPAGRL